MAMNLRPTLRMLRQHGPALLAAWVIYQALSAMVYVIGWLPQARIYDDGTAASEGAQGILINLVNMPFYACFLTLAAALPLAEPRKHLLRGTLIQWWLLFCIWVGMQFLIPGLAVTLLSIWVATVCVQDQPLSPVRMLTLYREFPQASALALAVGGGASTCVLGAYFLDMMNGHLAGGAWSVVTTTIASAVWGLVSFHLTVVAEGGK